MSKELWQMSAVETAEAIRNHRVSCSEVVEAHLKRIEDLNPGLNAITYDQAEEAVEAAKLADKTVQSGSVSGPLHGVPTTIKENTDQAGLPTPQGVAAFTGLIAKENSPVVANLLNAGAIIIGRTNTPEFNFRWHTDTPLRGATLNPWDPTLTPGGSSGGAAVAAVTGMGAFAQGNDMAGSLRYPAYCCGVATIKTTPSRIGTYNSSAAFDRPSIMLAMSSQGPIAREVCDLRLALEVMSGQTALDPNWVPAPLSYDSAKKHKLVALTRCPAGVKPHPFVSQAIDIAARHLENAGYSIEEADPPRLEEVARNWGTLFVTECNAMYRSTIRELGSHGVNNMLDAFESLYSAADITEYVRATSERTTLMREWSLFFDKYQIILGPVSTQPPVKSTDEESGIDKAREIILSNQLMFSVNVLGLPAAAVPTGIVNGIPMGVQLIGPRFREDLCLDAAEVIERGAGIPAKDLWKQM